jgi:hypothetical protein
MRTSKAGENIKRALLLVAIGILLPVSYVGKRLQSVYGLISILTPTCPVQRMFSSSFSRFPPPGCSPSHGFWVTALALESHTLSRLRAEFSALSPSR